MPCANSDPVTGQASENVAAHKTYSNDRFGFAFEYPESWVVVEKQGTSPGQPLLSLRFLNREENVEVMRDYAPGSVSIDVFANPERQPVREWLDKQGWPFDAKGRSVTATSIGGLPALEVATGKMFAPNRFTYIATKDRVLRVSFLASDAQLVKQSFRFDR